MSALPSIYSNRLIYKFFDSMLPMLYIYCPGELEAKMQSQESSVIEKRLELVEKKTSLSYELLKSSNNAIIYLSLFFAILMMAIALRDGVRDQRRLTIW